MKTARVAELLRPCYSRCRAGVYVPDKSTEYNNNQSVDLARARRGGAAISVGMAQCQHEQLFVDFSAFD